MAPLYIVLVIAMVVVHVEGQCTSSVCPPFEEDGQCNHWSSKQWDMVTKILNHVEAQQSAMETLKADLDAQKAALHTQKADLGAQKAALDVQEEEQEALQDLLQTVLKSVQRHQSALDKLNSSFTNATGKIDEQEQSLELFGMEQQRLQSEKNVLEHQMSNISNAISSLRTNFRDSTSQLETRQQKIYSSLQYCSGLFSPDVRLANGGSYYGRLEVFYNNQWGTVCDDDFGTDDAKAFCRILGLPWNNASHKAQAYYGHGSGRIWLDQVSCQSSACSIAACSHNGWGSHDCSHSEDVGIYCQ